MLALAISLPAFAAEPWADERLSVTNDLLLWLDVSRQNAARGAADRAPLQSWNDAPDVLLDGSGHTRHLHQPLLSARPRFRQEFNGAMLSFDGANDFLSATLGKTSAAEITIFAVAAPHTNGWFRGLLAVSAAGQNDYTSGLNLDFGSAATSLLSAVNAEGAGFPREANLLRLPKPFGTWHVFTLAAGRGTDGVKLFLDGELQRARDRTEESTLRLDEFTLGARRYSNTADRPHVQGHFMGELTEVLIFGKLLSESERTAVEQYLDAKYGALLRGLTPANIREGAVPLITVKNPPPIQMHFPGFASRELPVDLGNINNLRYRPDGKLLAVGYDGRIWLLSDSNGDGLEDKVEPFWDKQTLRAAIGAALTPPGYGPGDGVFVAAKEKLALIIDTNRDDRADQEISVAAWTRGDVHGVDALGVAVGPDQSIYFSLGSANFTEPYLIDRATSKARYNLEMDRGTIQRVAPDFSKRETVCTGIRFAVGLAFNREGDLFCTDQEGATWVPNGNPFDELLHIQTGRHYGFPAHHPRHLPNVIDEPSVFDFVPQHQSTCGLQFNDPVNGGPVFGPAAWSDDAIVAGYSRGKLWKTKLIKTPLGYVAQTHLLATIQSLVVDACVSPRGDLIVATHSGLPDWGSGPAGKGKLWRIRYADKTAAQPNAAWNASPTELRVAFDRPVDPANQSALVKARLESGKYAFPGDRFETIRPGYQIVYDQLAAPRFAHEILSTQLTPDRRTVTFITRPRVAALNYAIALDGQIGSSPDLRADLTGMQADWTAADGKENWSGWLPHIDLAVSGEFTQSSAEHENFFTLLSRPGKLRLTGQLDLKQMLQPAVQPGSSIDWTPPAEEVLVTFEASRPFEVRFDTAAAQHSRAEAGRHRVTYPLAAPGAAWHSFELHAPDARDLALTAWWSTAEDPRHRAFPLRRIYVPWAKPVDSATPPATERHIPEIAGGNWQRGRDLFFSEKLACSKCHAVGGQGGDIGPDLSNLAHRDYASVRKDIQFPNAALNPDHAASLIELHDGELLNTIIKREADGILHLALASGTHDQLPRAKVKSIKPAQLSLMPEGIWDALTPEEQRDLMSFLLTTPPKPHPPQN